MNKEERIQAVTEALNILEEIVDLKETNKSWHRSLLQGMGAIGVARQLLRKSK